MNKTKTQENTVEKTMEDLVDKINYLKTTQSDSDFDFSDDSEDELE